MKFSGPRTLSDRQRQDHSVLALRGAQATLQWWQNQAAAIEEDRRKVLFILPVGFLVTVALLPFFPRSAFAVAALALLATMQGMYLVTVHRWEFAHNVVEAKKELWIAQKNVSDSLQADEMGVAKKIRTQFVKSAPPKSSARSFAPKEI